LNDRLKRKKKIQRRMEENHDEDDSGSILRVDDYDWGDITPIQQDDGPDPVVMIAYPQECKCSLIFF
jgi:hypothetical protein